MSLNLMLLGQKVNEVFGNRNVFLKLAKIPLSRIMRLLMKL